MFLARESSNLYVSTGRRCQLPPAPCPSCIYHRWWLMIHIPVMRTRSLRTARLRAWSSCSSASFSSTCPSESERNKLTPVPWQSAQGLFWRLCRSFSIWYRARNSQMASSAATSATHGTASRRTRKTGHSGLAGGLRALCIPSNENEALDQR